MRPVNKHLYEFGSFRLDTGDRMLLRQGQYVPVTPKALETLVVLVEHGGRIVDKQELLRQVWPDTFVEDVTLAKNVSTLRKILGDSDQQRFIETIPKRGYRFVAEVRVLEDQQPGRVETPAAEPPAQVAVLEKPEAPSAAVNPSSLTRAWPWLLALLVTGLGIGFVLFSRRADREAYVGQQSISPKNIPLTSFSGRQNQAAFSPDGRRIAFVWNGPQNDGTHIYLKTIGGESLLQLTHERAADSKPAWSPDGRQISFLRDSGNGRAWYLVPAVGGPERKLADISSAVDLGNANSPYFAPDGESLAIVDRPSPGSPASIFGLSLRTGERRRITTPPAGFPGDDYPAFSPDGKLLAFSRLSGFSAADLHVVSLSSGKVRRLTFDGLSVEGLSWTPDSREIVFSSRRGGSINSLWRIAASGGVPQSVSPTAEELTSPAVSSSNGRLAYTRALDDINIWSITLDAAGRAVSKAPLIASTFRDSDPDYSPDGSKIAFVSGRAGSFGIWVSNNDGSNPRLIFDGGPYVSGSPHWSPDGRSIVFDSRSKDAATVGSPFIGVIGSDGRQFRRLTAVSEGGSAPSWSRDGRSIYFASTRSGSLNVWKMAVSGGPGVQITRNGGFEAFESPDGKYLYYLKGRAMPGLWRVPVNGGDEFPVPVGDQAGRWRSWRVEGKGIYFVSAAPPNGPRIEFFDLSMNRTSELVPMEKAPDFVIPSLAISPDRTHMLYAQYDHGGSNIMMVEGFR